MTENRIIGPTADPELSDLVLKIKQDIFYSMNCIQVGTIQDYNQLTNDASISINYKRQLPTGKVIDYPLLVQCPVFILSGGSARITMPIEKGDQCLILFNDRDIDNWYYQGKVDVPSTPRAHAISDGFALVGVSNLPNASFHSLNVIGVDAGEKKIAFKNDVANFKLLMDSTLDAISAITVGPSSTPLSAASIAAIQALKVIWANLLDEGVL
jgi:hypothetical protein